MLNLTKQLTTYQNTATATKSKEEKYMEILAKDPHPKRPTLKIVKKEEVKAEGPDLRESETKPAYASDDDKTIVPTSAKHRSSLRRPPMSLLKKLGTIEQEEDWEGLSLDEPQTPPPKKRSTKKVAWS